MYLHTGTFITKPLGHHDYVCVTCGYFEQYIDDAAKLAEVGRKWARVTPGDPAPRLPSR